VATRSSWIATSDNPFPSWRDTGRLIFVPFFECLSITQPNVQFDRKIDLGIDRHEYEDSFLPFYSVWSCLEGIYMKNTQADACIEMLTIFVTPYHLLAFRM
jgi:hypothetical protein